MILAMNHSCWHGQCCKWTVRKPPQIRPCRRFDANFLHRFHRLPFDWKTPIGYLFALAAESVSAHSALFCFTPIISFFVGSAWLIICSLEDISNDLTELNGSKTSNKNPDEVKEHFCHVIRFYSDARQLSRTFHLSFPLQYL